MSESNTFYITTAIDYPNSVPHMGHAYEKVVADFYARAERLRGRDVRFLIGLDEHGQKIQEAADQRGMSPQAFVDEKAEVFRELYGLLEVSNDDFIRTSEERHHAFVGELFLKLQANGDIYKGFYEGEYCISCERFYTSTELVAGKCPIHERPTSLVKEESYFFRLGKYREAVRDHIRAHEGFIYPAERRNEVLSRLDDEVRDLSISRSTFDWGIPLPGDPKHVLYVWVDALSNYISALERPVDLRARFWPASCHVIGKDILWFHTVIWPAMLLSAGYELPRQVYVHGFILDRDGRKMAKHLGNVVDPLEVVREWSVDVMRYYFLRSFSSGKDGKFALEEMAERYQTELGNDLGNLILRVVKLVQTKLEGTVPVGGDNAELLAKLDPRTTVAEYFEAADTREHHRAVEVLWAYIRAVNAYLNEAAPWKLRERADLERVLGASSEALRFIAHLLVPVMPRVAAAIADSLGFALGDMVAVGAPRQACVVKTSEPLFPRRDDADKKAAPSRPSAPAESDPFAKLEIRVGRIDEVREHPDAEQLFAMVVDLGTEKRSICAGLRKHLKREDLLGRRVAVLANLKPAMLRGIESAGMVLASDRADGAVVPVDPGEAPLGDLVTVEGIATQPKSKLSKSNFEKAPLVMQGGVVTYAGKPLRTSSGPLTCDAADGAPVR
jgi:methionyl-tRNA synthetase